MTNPDRLGSSPFAKSYAESDALAEDVDLQADGGGPCRAIRIGEAGDLVLKLARAPGTAVTFYALGVGEMLRVQAVAIVATGSTAKKMTVMW